MFINTNKQIYDIIWWYQANFQPPSIRAPQELLDKHHKGELRAVTQEGACFCFAFGFFWCFAFSWSTRTKSLEGLKLLKGFWPCFFQVSQANSCAVVVWVWVKTMLPLWTSHFGLWHRDSGVAHSSQETGGCFWPTADESWCIVPSEKKNLIEKMAWALCMFWAAWAVYLVQWCDLLTSDGGKRHSPVVLWGAHFEPSI